MEIRHPASESGPKSQYVLETKARTFPKGRPPVVLIVEDHVGSASVLALIFRHEGYVVHVASTIQQALDIAGKCALDVVLSDLHLPDGHGSKLMAALQAQYQLPGIAMTGDGAACDSEELRAHGFSHALCKPLEFADLFAAIHTVLEAREKK